LTADRVQATIAARQNTMLGGSKPLSQDSTGMSLHRLELTETEKQLPYAAYYYRESVAIPGSVLGEIQNATHYYQQALHFENINDLLNPGYLPLENGHCRMPDGSFFVAVRTEFFGVTKEMLDWWFWWYAQEPLRYRIWYPECHSDISVKGTQEESSNKPRYWHTTHFPVEDIGLGKEKLSIQFLPPDEFGFDTSRFSEANIVTAICGVVGSVTRNVKQHTYMCHLVRKYSSGLEMRSRFWIGHTLRFNGILSVPILRAIVNIKFVKQRVLPEKTGLAMAMHCAQEHNNLAKFLPELYAAYG
jgi:hypothetical protein